MSSWPTWSPSASTARARSSLSLTMNETPAFRQSRLSATASSNIRRVDALFSRYWTIVTPPRIAASTTPTWLRPRDRPASVTRYNRYFADGIAGAGDPIP